MKGFGRLRRSKYGSRKAEADGMVFDSATERDRWVVLRAAEARGEIACLRRQVGYELVPRQVETTAVAGRRGVRLVERFREHPVRYVADFVYERGGVEVIEDVKGMRTPEYVIKRKLMRWLGHPVTEVRRACEGFEVGQTKPKGK